MVLNIQYSVTADNKIALKVKNYNLGFVIKKGKNL